MSRRQIALVAFAVFDLLLAAVFVGLWIARSNLADERAMADLGVALLEQAAPLEEFQLIDQTGKEFGRSDLAGNWNFIFFGFTSCPDICPLTMQVLGGFYSDLEPSGLQADTQVIMVTVDPLRDTPDVMADYLRSFHPDFVGLTGDYPRLAELASQLYIAFSQPGEHGHGDMHGEGDYVVAHSEYIAVVDPDGRYRGIINAPHRRKQLMEAYLALRNGS